MGRALALFSCGFLLATSPAMAQMPTPAQWSGPEQPVMVLAQPNDPGPSEAAPQGNTVLAPTEETAYVPVGYDVRWTFTAEALWLQRATDGPVATSEPLVGPPVASAFVGDQFRPGLRLGLWRHGVDGNSWEASYFGLNRWADDATVLGDPVGFSVLAFSPILFFDDIIGGFDTSVAVSYRATVHNAELNRWWLTRDNGLWNVQWMAGVRYFTFQEQLSATGVDSFFGTEVYDAAAYNHLIGGQVGARFERTFNRLGIFGIAKAGLYGNFWSYRLNDVITTPVGFPPPPVAISTFGTSTAGLLEFQLGSRYRLTDWASIIGSYNVYYVPGVTLQPTTGGLPPNHADGLVLHGGSIGLQLNW